MPITVSPTQPEIFTKLRAFILSILQIGIPVYTTQVNRVPQPRDTDFVMVTPMMIRRLRTNEDFFTDAVFTGSIADDVMTITAVEYGELKVGSVVLGVDVEVPTVVVAILTGSGGIGTYEVTPSQTIASRTLTAGYAEFEHGADMSIQLDVYGPESCGNSAIIATMLRDDYATTYFEDTPAMTPLYCDDPRQMPFINEEGQFEFRWIVMAHLQVNFTSVFEGQQFFPEAEITVINVDAAFPPT